MINPRKLAAIDIVLLGPRVIIAEFAVGVLFSIARALRVIRIGYDEAAAG